MDSLIAAGVSVTTTSFPSIHSAHQSGDSVFKTASAETARSAGVVRVVWDRGKVISSPTCRMSDGKPCKVCNFTRQQSIGLVALSLDELKTKGRECLGFSPSAPVTVVLEDDGTIVEDQAYYLCLPSNTKFMLLQQKEAWSPVRRMDGGTAWMARDSVMLETDSVDASSGAAAAASWRDLAQRVKQDVANVILMSEGDLQTLVDVPCLELASALGFQEKQTKELQEQLQGFLDRKEEERQSKQLLQLYIKVMEEGNAQQQEQSEPSQGVARDVDVLDGVEVDSASGFTSRTLMVLKGKTSPETRLSTEDLQLIVTRGGAMEQVLGWDKGRTSLLLRACDAELTRRLQQVQAAQSIRNSTEPDSSL
ncbi:DNA fragmentation factor subunit alpha [Betta splendens]|uniref:DNAation factor subunit alpha n=1 Tax=Betta splendens TaxID=158456 RepID=A0A6P7MY53_BETSP|nr:DNA fragmentation factor subunit alpha [Betta splendens]